jgi:hypothetical protein
MAGRVDPDARDRCCPGSVKLTCLGTRGYIEPRTERHHMHSSMMVSYYNTDLGCP